jgi:phosphoribosylamine--glycine ligase
MRQVIEPTVQGLAAEGIPYTGFLYAGVMIDAAGIPKVLEYNCRFGDPETQPIMLRMKSDLVAHCLAALEGRLNQEQAEWDPRASLGVVLAANGYPASYHKDDLIEGLPEAELRDAKVFHAGTRSMDGRILTAGGRVICATALGTTVLEAQAKAYELVRRVEWPGACYRTDIGYRAIAREKT